MPESIYKPSYGMVSVSEGELIGIGDVPLVILGCAVMNLSLNEAFVQERVYVVKGASKLLLQYLPSDVLALHKKCHTYSVKAVQNRPDHHPLRSWIEENILK